MLIRVEACWIRVGFGIRVVFSWWHFFLCAFGLIWNRIFWFQLDRNCREPYSRMYLERTLEPCTFWVKIKMYFCFSSKNCLFWSALPSLPNLFFYITLYIKARNTINFESNMFMSHSVTQRTGIENIMQAYKRILRLIFMFLKTSNIKCPPENLGTFLPHALFIIDPPLCLSHSLSRSPF